MERSNEIYERHITQGSLNF